MSGCSDLKGCLLASKLTGLIGFNEKNGNAMKHSFGMMLCTGVIGALLLAGCGQQDSPVQAVQSYLNYRVVSDESKLLSVSCKDWENDAQVEAASFQSMNAKLDGMSCSQTGTDGAYTLVACKGKIVTTYAGETRSRDLADRSFKTIQEDGHWKVCGYQQATPGQ